MNLLPSSFQSLIKGRFMPLVPPSCDTDGDSDIENSVSSMDKCQFSLTSDVESVTSRTATDETMDSCPTTIEPLSNIDSSFSYSYSSDQNAVNSLLCSTRHSSTTGTNTSYEASESARDKFFFHSNLDVVTEEEDDTIVNSIFQEQEEDDVQQASHKPALDASCNSTAVTNYPPTTEKETPRTNNAKNRRPESPRNGSYSPSVLDISFCSAPPPTSSPLATNEKDSPRTTNSADALFGKKAARKRNKTSKKSSRKASRNTAQRVTATRIDITGAIMETEITQKIPSKAALDNAKKSKRKSKKHRKNNTVSLSSHFGKRGKRGGNGRGVIQIQSRGESMVFRDNTSLVSHITTETALQPSPLEGEFIEFDSEEFAEEEDLVSAITIPRAIRKANKKSSKSRNKKPKVLVESPSCALKRQ